MGGVGGAPAAPTSNVPRFPLRIAELTDGLSNILGVIEAGPPVPWSKPADLVYDAKKPLPPMTGPYSNVRHIATLDGAVHALRPKLDETTWRHLIEPNDGNPLPDWKTLRARFAADAEEEKKTLAKLREDHQTLLITLDEQYQEQVMLLSLKSKLGTDLETASEQAEELKRAIDTLKVKNRKLRDELGVRRDGPVPVPERKP
jgi:hypothetical protein